MNSIILYVSECLSVDDNIKVEHVFLTGLYLIYKHSINSRYIITKIVLKNQKASTTSQNQKIFADFMLNYLKKESQENKQTVFIFIL